MTVDVRPQWTEKLYRPSGGQDHLGLGSVSSDRILPKLVPGINVLTFHPRYWSFYTFVLDEFWRRDLPRTRRAFVEFYRPCEAIFAVGAQLCDQPEHEQYGRLRGVVGAQKASPYAALDPEAFDPQFGYMDSDLGGYGLYYATTIAAMGLIAPALAGTNLSFDAPTPEGRIVAAGFRSAVADTVYYREYFADSSRPVPYEVVLDYIRRACLCQLQTAAAPDRELLRLSRSSRSTSPGRTTRCCISAPPVATRPDRAAPSQISPQRRPQRLAHSPSDCLLGLQRSIRTTR